MCSTRKKTIDDLKENDFRLLHELYERRILTGEQFRKIGGYSANYVFKKLREYRRLGVANKRSMHGTYDRTEKRQRSSYEITGKGVRLIREKVIKPNLMPHISKYLTQERCTH